MHVIVNKLMTIVVDVRQWARHNINMDVSGK